jgi:uncharacterized protein YjdB
VDASGLVTAKAAGTTTITVTTEDGNKTATCAMTTTLPIVVPVTGVSLNLVNQSLEVGQTFQLTATVSPSNADIKAVSWSSNNESVASVSSSGLVTANAAGTATITVTTANENKTATCAITVTNIPVTGVSLNFYSGIQLRAVGQTCQLTETITPSNATNKAVSWSSSNESVASVSTSGLVTAKAFGSATITVTTADGNKTATRQLTVHSDYEVNSGILVGYNGAGGNVVIPDNLGITEISQSAFIYNATITSVVNA